MSDTVLDGAGERSTMNCAGLPPIKGFIETSFIDWKGMVSSVLFLPGCNFKCPFCHNFNLVKEPEVYETLSFEHIKERLAKFKGWIDGVVVSGGEPTLHPGLPELLGAIKAQGFKTKLDSNGHRPKVLRRLIDHGLVDMVAMDLKAPLEPLAYRRAAGCPVELERVQESLDLLIQGGTPHEIRSTIWPLWHGEAELKAMAASVRGAQAWTLQIMKLDTAWNLEPLGDGQPYTQTELDRLQKEIADPACKPA
jgi:pyruvate formate lyase activating enzyme